MTQKEINSFIAKHNNLSIEDILDEMEKHVVLTGTIKRPLWEESMKANEVCLYVELLRNRLAELGVK